MGQFKACNPHTVVRDLLPKRFWSECYRAAVLIFPAGGVTEAARVESDVLLVAHHEIRLGPCKSVLLDVTG